MANLFTTLIKSVSGSMPAPKPAAKPAPKASAPTASRPAPASSPPAPLPQPTYPMPTEPIPQLPPAPLPGSGVPFSPPNMQSPGPAYELVQTGMGQPQWVYSAERDAMLRQRAADLGIPWDTFVVMLSGRNKPMPGGLSGPFTPGPPTDPTVPITHAPAPAPPAAAPSAEPLALETPPTVDPLAPVAMPQGVSDFSQWLMGIIGSRGMGGNWTGGSASPLLGPAFYQTQRSSTMPRSMPPGYSGAGPSFPSLSGPRAPSFQPSAPNPSYAPTNPTRLA